MADSLCRSDHEKGRAGRQSKAVAGKIPETILQEDSKLLMWYDQAITRMGDEA